MFREEFEQFVLGIDNYVYDLSNKSKDIAEEVENYEMAITSLELLIMQKMKKICKVSITGLQEVGVAKDDDVIDLHIIMGENYFEKSDKERDIGITAVLRDFLDYSDDWRILRIFDDQPTIECEFFITNQKFLISIGNGLKIEEYKILRHLFSIQPEAVTFYHFIRHWILEKSSCAIDPKHLLLLVVFFLQKDGFMPAIFDVFLDVPKIIIDNYQVQYEESHNLHSYHLKRMDYYREHILEFFHYYQNFDFYYYLLNVHRGYKTPFKQYLRYIHNAAALNIIFVRLDDNFAPHTKYYQISDFMRICKVSYKLFKEY